MTTTIIPTNADELEDMIGNGAVADMFEGGKPKAEFTDWVRNYVKALRAKDPAFEQQVKEEVQRVTAEWLRDNNAENVGRLDLSPGKKLGNRQGTDYNPLAPGVEVDNMFDSIRDYLSQTWWGNESTEAAQAKAKLRDIRNSFGSTVPADGGFLIPETLRSQLLAVSLEKSIVRQRAMVVPMETLRVPFPTIDSASNASSVHGGVVCYWTEEGGALTESSATFGRVMLEARKLTAFAKVPNELFTDSLLSLQAWIGRAFPEALAWFEDIAFFSGTGVGEPLGFLNADAAVSVTKETNQVADTIVWQNIVKAYARMLPTSLGNAVWIANIDTFPELATMALNVGTGGGPVWLNNGVAGPPMTILGRPVIFTEKAPTVGDAGDINFVDLSYYLIGDRQTVNMATSEHSDFANDKTAIRFIERIDGRPWVQSAITPQTGSNTLSPFVKIAARA